MDQEQKLDENVYKEQLIVVIIKAVLSALLSQLTTLNDRLILSTSDNYAYRTQTLTYTHN